MIRGLHDHCVEHAPAQQLGNRRAILRALFDFEQSSDQPVHTAPVKLRKRHIVVELAHCLGVALLVVIAFTRPGLQLLNSLYLFLSDIDNRRLVTHRF